MNKYPKYFSSDYKFPRIIVFTNNNNNFSVDNSHAMIIVGYNDNYHAFKILNSWGKSWGYQGFCYMSYDIFDQSLTKTKIISSALIIDKILI
jgi:C1A family cysteine protease